MKIEQNELEDRQVELSVEVPQDMVSSAMQKTARRLSKQARIPGFRPGKAPYDVILRHFGEDLIFEEALETLGQDVYGKALEEAEINPVSMGSFNDILSRDPLVLKYTVPLTPVIELGTYEDLRVEFEEPEVTDEAEQEVLTMLQQSRAVIEPVDRPARLTDLVVVDLHGALVPREDEEAEGKDLHLTHDHSITLLVTEAGDYPFAGVHEHLIGLETGQEKDVEHTFPDDYEAEELIGRTAVFTFKCLDVKSRELPQLTDELATEIGEFEDLEDMRKKVREDLLSSARRQALEKYNHEVIGKIVEGAAINSPPVLLEQEIDDMVKEIDRNLHQRNFSLTDQLKLENKSLEEFREDIEPDAETRLKRSLVLGKIVEEQEISVSAGDIDAEVVSIRAQYPQADASLMKLLNHPVQRRSIEMELLTRKAIERISLIARGEYIPGAELQSVDEPAEGDNAVEDTVNPVADPAQADNVEAGDQA